MLGFSCCAAAGALSVWVVDGADSWRGLTLISSGIVVPNVDF